MARPARDHVTLVEAFELTRPFEEVAVHLRATVERLEREGVRALVAMNFYLDEATGELGAVITFEDADHFMEHARMISGWPEFQAFAGSMPLTDMRIHGRLTAEAEAWIRQFQGPIRTLEGHVTGFFR